MALIELWIGAILFELTLWLALYLIGRAPKNVLGWLSGTALLAISIGLVVLMLGEYAPSIRLAQQMIRWQQFLFILAVFLWLLSLFRLVPNEALFKKRFQQTRTAMIIVLGGTILFALGTVGVLFPVGISHFVGMVYSAILFFVMGSAVSFVIAHERSEALLA